MSYYTEMDHTFAVCAYKESSYLEECIQSLVNQSIKSHIIICTATPNEYIDKLAKKYNIDVYVNEDGCEIAKDWNFAVKMADTDLVTLAHQDDTYEPCYLERILDGFNRTQRPLIAFSDYGEWRNGVKVTNNRLLKIKKMMLYPLRNKLLWNSRFVRRRILSFGSAICCPSVTYVKTNLELPIFASQYRSDLDWQAWEKLSREKGAFVYCPEELMYHRIHEESATTAIIADNDRTKEDFEMFCRFWPKWIAKIIEYFYQKGEDSNGL